LLGLAETTHLGRMTRVDAELHQALLVSHRRDDQPAIREGNEASVEEKICRRCQEKPVLSADSLAVAGMSPGLDMACDQVSWIGHVGNSTGPLHARHVASKETLPTPCLDECLSIRGSHGFVVELLDLMLLPPLPLGLFRGDHQERALVDI